MLSSLNHRCLGRYYIKELLGRGGMAAVYRAVDTVLQRDVALKILHPHYSDDATVVERFKREATIAASLTHPNIVPVYDVGEQQGMAFIAMQLLTGRTLQERLQEAGVLSLAELLDVLKPIAAALDYAHSRGIIHRDVKPSNIFLSDAAEGPRALLTDFGIAKLMAAPGLTATGALLGTPDYMAPEQIAGDPVGPPSDIYALGILTYRALTGCKAFEGDPQDVLLGHLYGQLTPPSQVNPALPTSLDAVIARATARDPAGRYPCAGAFVQDLDRVARSAGAITASAPPSATGPETTEKAVIPPSSPVPPQTALLSPTPVGAAMPIRGIAPDQSRRASIVWLAVIGMTLLVGGLALMAGMTHNDRLLSLPSPLPPTSVMPVPTRTAAAPSHTPTPPVTTAPAGVALASVVPAATATPTLATATPTSAPTSSFGAATPTPAPDILSTSTATPWPSPTVLPTATATLSPTAAAAATPTATPTETTACPEEWLTGGFGRLFRANVNVRVGLRCPLAPEIGGIGSVQFFERGAMFYWDAMNRTRWRDYIFVFEGLDTGAYRAFSPEAVAALGPAPTPGPDSNQPVRGFGRVYFYQAGVSDSLGAWTSPELPLRDPEWGAIQLFEGGIMLYTPIYRSEGHGSIFVLYNTGQFERYDDSPSG